MAVRNFSVASAPWCTKTSQIFTLLLILLVLAGCSANPVTGKKELSLYSTADEVEIGETYYPYAQQAEGGQYKLDPALTEYVAAVGQRIADVSDRTLPFEFVILNNSTPNAWTLPGGKIAINRGLLVELENEAELAAVLGHEIVHAAARHGVQRLNRGLILQLVILGVVLAGDDIKHSSYVVGFGGVALHLINHKYSRKAERLADYHGIKYMYAAGYDTFAAVTVQEKFVALAEGNENNWLTGLFASHPPSTERLENNKVALDVFPAGGELGRDGYKNQLVHLRARHSAYTRADQARRLLDKSPENALHSIEEAIKQEPRESIFYGIKGQAYARQRRYRAAIKSYDAAIGRDPDYYEHYLGRGLAYDALNRQTNARIDLERSISLLQTELATYALGKIVLQDGDREYAKSLFRSVVEANGEFRQAAYKDFIMLDVVDAPWRYITVEPFFKNRQVIVKVENSTAYAFQNIEVRIVAKINGNQIYRRLQEKRLPAHALVALESSIHYREEDSVEVEVRVMRANPVNSYSYPSQPYRSYP